MTGDELDRVNRVLILLFTLFFFYLLALAVFV